MQNIGPAITMVSSAARNSKKDLCGCVMSIYRLDAEAKGSRYLEYLKTYIKPEGDSPRVL